MDMVYNNKTLYINISEKIDAVFIKKLYNRVDSIISSYHIPNVEINILNNAHYNDALLADFIKDINNRYPTSFIIK